MNFKRNLKNTSTFLFFGICLILIGYFINSSNKVSVKEIISTPTPISTKVSESSYSKVIKVIDGDTIEIEGGLKVRYIGIDTTEIYPKVECYSQEAKAKNEELVGGKVIKLKKDISETDKYGRLLRYVYVDNEFVNDDLVKNGFAKIETVPPDVKFKNQFLESEKYAQENSLGLWNTCKSF